MKKIGCAENKNNVISRQHLKDWFGFELEASGKNNCSYHTGLDSPPSSAFVKQTLMNCLKIVPKAIWRL